MQQVKKRRLLASVAAGTLGLSYLTAEYLFNFAFKRVDYVPETSANKQKYAAQHGAGKLPGHRRPQGTLDRRPS